MLIAITTAGWLAMAHFHVGSVAGHEYQAQLDDLIAVYEKWSKSLR
jgi:hypothetical protein